MNLCSISIKYGMVGSSNSLILKNPTEFCDHRKFLEVTIMLHGNERIIKHKLGHLNLADELGNISLAGDDGDIQRYFLPL